MANKYLPHIQIFPEDDANRDIVQALLLEIGAKTSRYKVFPTQKGWIHVLDNFAAYAVTGMRTFPQRYVVLIIDLDDKAARLAEAQKKIPLDLADRVFIFGCLSEPERLKVDFGNFDAVGEALGKSCLDQGKPSWGHPLLKVNLPELTRFREVLCPHIF
jgi:hypothetical protein